MTTLAPWPRLEHTHAKAAGGKKQIPRGIVFFFFFLPVHSDCRAFLQCFAESTWGVQFVCMHILCSEVYFKAKRAIKGVGQEEEITVTYKTEIAN